MSNYNVDLMLEVRDMLLRYPDQHRQAEWVKPADSNPLDDCGTTACVAGWTISLMGHTLSELREKDLQASKVAAQALGLNWEEAYDLFIHTMDEAAAVALLDKYIEKGKSQGA